jgi:hypothetical protein
LPATTGSQREISGAASASASVPRAWPVVYSASAQCASAFIAVPALSRAGRSSVSAISPSAPPAASRAAFTPAISACASTPWKRLCTGI